MRLPEGPLVLLPEARVSAPEAFLRSADVRRATQRRRREEGRLCRNPHCRRSLAGKRPHARACGGSCRMAGDRAERRAKRAYEHPRCVVCDDPMDWSPKPMGAGNLNLRAVTCKRKCAYTRANWLRAA